MQIVRLKGATTLREIALLLFSVAIIAASVFFTYQYMFLKSHDPFENITVVGKVDEESNILMFTATFDRSIKCNATKFELHLRNAETDEIDVLGLKDLAIAPPRNQTPEKNKTVKFGYSIPDYVGAGTWAAQFNGVYECKNGLFTDTKWQVIDSNQIAIK